MVEQADDTETPGVSSPASDPGQAATRLDERDIAILEAVAARGDVPCCRLDVVEVKYGRRLQALFGRPTGAALHRRIDDMFNEECPALIRRDGATVRARLVNGLRAEDRARSPLPSTARPMMTSQRSSTDLSGHDIGALTDAFDEAAAAGRPSDVLAYTIKGWRLPFAGDASNHSALLTADQVRVVADHLGADPDHPWAAFPEVNRAGVFALDKAPIVDATPRPVTWAPGRPGRSWRLAGRCGCRLRGPTRHGPRSARINASRRRRRPRGGRARIIEVEIQP